MGSLVSSPAAPLSGRRERLRWCLDILGGGKDEKKASANVFETSFCREPWVKKEGGGDFYWF